MNLLKQEKLSEAAMLKIVEDGEIKDQNLKNIRNAILVVQQLAPEHRSKAAEASVRVSVICLSSEVISFDISFTKNYLAYRCLCRPC